MSFMYRGEQVQAAELAAAPLEGIVWDDYAAIMRAILRDPDTPAMEERLRLTYVLMDLAAAAGLDEPA